MPTVSLKPKRGAARATCLFLLVTAAAYANPFMGSADKPVPAPVRSGGGTLDIVVRGQLELRERIAGYFRSWDEDHSGSALLLMAGISFLYGIAHALGPGHRKTVVLSIYLSRKAPWWEPLASAAVLSGLHGGAAIILMLAFRGVTSAVTMTVNSVSLYIEGAAYGVLVMMAAVLLVRSILDLRGKKERDKDAVSLGTLLLTGVYPCPGAVLVLILALDLDIVGIGILSVIAMSAGMCVPITAFAYLGWLGRFGVLQRIRNNAEKLRIAGAVIDITGFTILLLFSLYIALPFLASLPGLFP